MGYSLWDQDMGGTMQMEDYGEFPTFPSHQSNDGRGLAIGK